MKYQKKTKPALWQQLPSAKLAKGADAARKRVSGYDAALRKRLERDARAKLKPRKAIRRVSKKKSASDKVYNARVKEWLIGKRCAVFYPMPATQCHHQRGRLKALLMDERFWIPVSADGHRWIDANREQARHRVAIVMDGRNLMLLCERGDWHKQP